LGEKFGGLAADGGNTALKANMYIAQGVALGIRGNVKVALKGQKH
jgi:hypothetical protein